jgi:hypothetical protein
VKPQISLKSVDSLTERHSAVSCATNEFFSAMHARVSVPRGLIAAAALQRSQAVKPLKRAWLDRPAAGDFFQCKDSGLSDRFRVVANLLSILANER